MSGAERSMSCRRVEVWNPYLMSKERPGTTMHLNFNSCSKKVWPSSVQSLLPP
jgi:hypothetical protein